MKILVPIARVIDLQAAKIRLKADLSGIATDGVKMSVNPFDEYAIEAALRIKEESGAEIVGVTVDTRAAGESLRTALAAGIDRAIHIVTENGVEVLAILHALTKIAEEERPDLILMGDRAADGENGQIGPMLAARLGWPLAVNASEILHGQNGVRVKEEADGGKRTVEMSFPALITAGTQLKPLRNISLPNIMKAKKKVIDERTGNLDWIGDDLDGEQMIIAYAEPPRRRGGRIVKSVEELVATLGLGNT